MESVSEQLIAFATTYGLKILGALIILILGRIAAGIARRIVRQLLTKANTDKSIVTFVGSLIYTLIIVFAIVAALAKFGVETASFIAILGAVGFAVGFALQGSLANFAAGVLILVLRPYKVGDYIEGGGVAGSVKAIQLFTTVLATPDNIKIMVPNGKIFGDVIKNVTAFDTRRQDIVVGIAYGASIQKAHDVYLNLIQSDERILTDPAPQVIVSELADSSVNLTGRFWVKKEDYWAVRFDITRKVKEAFDANDIEIPFPQRVVHMAPQAAA
ncbi:MAG: mechanosensitive ion channel [Candidatus Latescibacteria bacterium]|nr:mechanosensitive ion channel [Candidatus Latescibacterota bacterium]NIM21701.1 mechanosensitive ion channel [Candidatus Latescibacterota bacterium]NIM65728.1 mechanosensitive ion channel [Candidatus Latescibacterota bacterium]NIO02113.1 mechanosensitive ion channel [Candidatus Latescibacterota bacterium]NIO28930.1 mechanosensitive ion channel [Candidatus Latescibacterota bacterium]